MKGVKKLKVNHVQWRFDEKGSTLIDQLKVSISGGRGTFTLRMLLKDGDGVILQEKTFNNQKLPGSILWDLEPSVDAADIFAFDIEVSP